jgi:hydroxymethylbilane synthase
LAAAGLRRLGCEARIAEVLAPPRVLPAPGQGSLGIECREDDDGTRELLARLDDVTTRAGVTAERVVLAALHGGCSAPIAAWGRVEEGELHVDGLVADVEGRRMLRATAAGKVSDADRLGRRVADELRRQGAIELIESARRE